MQRSRRRDPYPFTWEIPAAVAATVVLVLVFGVHIGRAAANVLAGQGGAWPARVDLFRTLPAILSGRADAGLSTATLWTCIALTELLLVIGLGWALKRGLDRWGPNRLQGMATRGEAEQMLGLARLRRVAGIVRPDLYGKEGKRG